MNNSLNKKKADSATIISAVIVLLIYVAVFVAEQFIAPTSMLFTVLKKGATYALVAVSMNLLNGFTGIFSLGQAGFMLIGAYVYGIFTVPVAERINVYQYYNGGLVQFVLPWFVAMALSGLVAAFFAFLIGMPVLRLKSDYLAIASLGFAEIIRAVMQWDKLGPITNGSNMLRLFPSFNDFNIRAADGHVVVYLSTLVPLLIAGVCIGVIILLINSTFGRALKAIRDDEIAAEAMGIRLASHKRLAFCISSFLFVAASEWWLRFLDQKQMIGSFEVPLLRNGFRLVVFSIIIMIVVLFFRKGIMGTRELPDVIRGWQRMGKGKEARAK